MAWKIGYKGVIHSWTVDECAIVGSNDLVKVCENDSTGGQIAGFCKAGDTSKLEEICEGGVLLGLGDNGKKPW